MALQKLVLVVDDDLSFLGTVERLLKVYGFDVQAFNTAEAFLDGANLADAGCAVLDVHLTGMSGIELRRRLALSGTSLPVIFVTANDSQVVRKAAFDTGCVAYLPKPFAASSLMNAIEKALTHAPQTE